jgi:hypothetical protein
MADDKDPVVDPDAVREQVHSTVERLREKLPEVLQDEVVPIPLVKEGDPGG